MALDGEYAAAADFVPACAGLRPDDAIGTEIISAHACWKWVERRGGRGELRAVVRNAPQRPWLAIQPIFACAASHGRFLFCAERASRKFLRGEKDLTLFYAPATAAVDAVSR